jgi:hypothetical protein
MDALHSPRLSCYPSGSVCDVMSFWDLMKEYWALVVAGVGSIAWLVRLESRGLSNEREIKRLWLQRKEDLDNARQSRDAQTKMLDEIRQDIKTLIRNQNKG